MQSNVGVSALGTASLKRRMETAQLLISKNSNVVDHQDREGRMALMYMQL